jgi:hypothetical protein
VFEFFYFDSFFLKKRNELNQNLFLISDPFESRRSGWCDSRRSCVSAHDVTHGASTWSGVDVAPRCPESHQED